MADHLAARVASEPEMETWEPRGLSIVCFRVVPGRLRGDEAALDALNRAVLTRVQLGGRALVTGTVVRGRFWLRACIVNHRHDGGGRRRAGGRGAGGSGADRVTRAATALCQARCRVIPEDESPTQDRAFGGTS